MKKKYLNLDEIQNIEFEILKMFDKICKKYDLRYSLAYGTMIGAVRHQGFIPWDDDVDVMMLREDYDKLIEIIKLEKDGIAQNYILLHDGMEEYFYPFYKICDMRTVAKADDNKTVHGVWIDVFPVDSVYEDDKKNEKLHKKFKFLKNLVLSYTTDFSAKNKNWKFIPKFFFSMLVRLYGIQHLILVINNKAKKERSKNKVSVLTWQSSLAGNMTKEDFDNLVFIDFEGVSFPIISDFDPYLKGIYGDYMQIPPKNKRKTHMLNVYYK